MTERRKTMKGLKLLAKKAHDNNNVTMRESYANSWRELATNAEASKAPRYLTWTTRKGGWNK